MTSFRIGQYCRFSRIRNDEYRIYQFCLFLDNSYEELRTVDQVVYTLDPSFPSPTRTAPNDAVPYSGMAHCFALQSEAYGQFVTRVLVVGTDGQTFRLSHVLELTERGWPLGERPGLFRSTGQREVFGALFDSKWEWRKLSTLARRAGLSTHEARAELLELEAGKFVRKAYYKSLEGEELWGATAVVGVLPTPRE